MTEAQGRDEALFGEERLSGLVEAAAGCPARELAERIRDAAIGFAGDAPQFDDITVVVLMMHDADV